MKRAVITGGTGALGTAVAERFVTDGYETWVTAISQADADRFTGNAKVRIINLTDLNALKGWAQTFDKVDALVLCAGGFSMQQIIDLVPEDLDLQINLNLRTAIYALDAFGPTFGKGSAAVLVGSQSYNGAAGMAAYAATKAAVVSLAKSSALEWKKLGVRVNAILPDTMDTAANRAAMPTADFEKWAKPSEVASVISFLCSENAALISGSAINLGR